MSRERSWRHRYRGSTHPRTAASLTDLERDRKRQVSEFIQNEFGYITIQSTRPGLIGAMLTDSPVAQLAWIADKFRAWTYPLDAAPEDVVGIEFLLAKASLYWFTGSAGSAAYVGYAQDEPWGDEPASSDVPTAVICFAHDIGIRRFVEDAHNITRWTQLTVRSTTPPTDLSRIRCSGIKPNQVRFYLYASE